MNLIQKYRRLPEANRVPDELYELDYCLKRIEALKAELDSQKLQQIQLTVALIKRLEQNWSDKEIAQAGFTADISGANEK